MIVESAALEQGRKGKGAGVAIAVGLGLVALGLGFVKLPGNGNGNGNGNGDPGDEDIISPARVNGAIRDVVLAQDQPAFAQGHPALTQDLCLHNRMGQAIPKSPGDRILRVDVVFDALAAIGPIHIQQPVRWAYIAKPLLVWSESVVSEATKWDVLDTVASLYVHIPEKATDIRHTYRIGFDVEPLFSFGSANYDLYVKTYYLSPFKIEEFKQILAAGSRTISDPVVAPILADRGNWSALSQTILRDAVDIIPVGPIPAEVIPAPELQTIGYLGI